MTDPLSMPEPTGQTPTVATAPVIPNREPVVSVPTGKHLATQTEYPWRNSLINGGVTTVAVLAAIAGGLSDPTVQALVNRYVPGQSATILGFGVFCGAVVTAIHRITNIPQVQTLFVRLHVGVIPKPKN